MKTYRWLNIPLLILVTTISILNFADYNVLHPTDIIVVEKYYEDDVLKIVKRVADTGETYTEDVTYGVFNDALVGGIYTDSVSERMLHKDRNEYITMFCIPLLVSMLTIIYIFFKLVKPDGK